MVRLAQTRRGTIATERRHYRPITITTEVNDAMNEAEQNAETVRRGYAAFNSGDMKTLTEFFDRSATWHTPGRNPIAGDHKGR